MAELNMGLFPQYKTPVAAQQEGFNYAEQVRQATANRQAGQLYATGDYTGASQTLARSGNLGDAQKLRAEGQQTNAAGLQYVAKALPVLEAIQKAHANDSDGGKQALASAFDQIAPEAAAATGATPQALATFKNALVADPSGTISRLRAQLPIQYQNVDGTLYGIQGMQATQLAQAPKFQTIAPGATLAPTNQAGAGVIQQLNGQQQPQTQAQPVQPQQSAPVTPSSDQVAAAITKYIPGAIITSTGRTPEHNAEVGGVPDSMHLNSQAVDFVMPKGVTFDQVKALVQQSGLPVTELLNEGSHVHIGWGPKGGQAPQQVAQAAPSNVYRAPPAFREPTAQEKQQFPGVSFMTAQGPHYPPAALTPTQLTPEALDDMAALALRNGGRLPPGYARDRATVAAVTNRLAQLKPPGMSSEDFARVMQNNLLQFEARKSAGGQAAKGQIGTAINEGTVNNSINILRKLIPIAASKGNFTQINDLQQFIRRSSNDANAANFKNAIDAISAEYARVMTGSTSGAPSSDAARNEAAHRILLGYNQNTLPAVLDQLQAEMRGRSESYKEVLSQLTGGYSGVNVPFDNGAPPAAAAPASDPKTDALLKKYGVK